MRMAKRAHVYPQVDPGAEGLVNMAIARVPAGARVADALKVARARNAGVVTPGGTTWVLREDLARGARLSLEDLPAAALARPLPSVEAGQTEVRVRRLLAAGAALVIVRDRRGPVGAVAPAPGRPDVGAALGPRFARRLSEATREALVAIGRLAVAHGMRTFLAGGTVRDAIREPATDPGGLGSGGDIDIVVEGDGLALARALAGVLGVPTTGALVEHVRFLTASLTVPAVGRIDIATARSERYETRGALPRVMPSTIGQDLARRDFAINAMAVGLASGTFELLDPFGGRSDLARRRLRVLHPLSFVEDPTRIFRAARYAARLGFSPDGWTSRAQALALSLAPYPALSGQRIAAELELILGDAHPDVALRRLGRVGAFRLLDARYRFRPTTAARVSVLGAALDWAGRHGLRVAPLELGALAVLGDQPREVAMSALIRLGLSGEPLARAARALDGAPALTRRLAAATRPSERARSLWDRADLELAWLWLSDEPPLRAAIEWFVARARGVRPALGGADIVALGVERGGDVARVLAALRDARLDGTINDRDGEAASVRDWIDGGMTDQKGGMGWLRNSSS